MILLKLTANDQSNRTRGDVVGYRDLSPGPNHPKTGTSRKPGYGIRFSNTRDFISAAAKERTLWKWTRGEGKAVK